jgi:hypothetical protein
VAKAKVLSRKFAAPEQLTLLLLTTPSIRTAEGATLREAQIMVLRWQRPASIVYVVVAAVSHAFLRLSVTFSVNIT